MPRALVVCNGQLLANFDLSYNLRDVYYPQVGRANQTNGRVSHTGIWIAGEFAWFDDPGWSRDLRYLPETLATDVTLEHQDLGLRIKCQDAVDLDRSVLVRSFRVENLADRPREARLFFHFNPCLWENSMGDTIYYEPRLGALVGYKGECYWVLDCQRGERNGVDDWATGVKEFNSFEGTWRDAEDGVLSRHPISQGSVDGTVGLNLGLIPPQGTELAYCWLAFSNGRDKAFELDRLVRERGPAQFLERTVHYWRVWVNKESVDFADLPANVVDLYKRSLLLVRTHLDRQGAILAATDSDITQFGRDTYAYVWPRDGALVATALDRAGYASLTNRFYFFCNEIVSRRGFFLHKYDPQGLVGSSWHPWVDEDGNRQYPIQEDETALVLHGLLEHYVRSRDIEFLSRLYRPIVKTCAEFLAGFREPHTGLPAPSYDLWGERHGIHAYTVAAVWSGLMAAAYFTKLFGEFSLAERYGQVALEMREAAIRWMFDPELGRFVRTVAVRPDGEVVRDPTVDSSLCGLFLLGMFSADDPMIEATVRAVREKLWVHTPVGGVARYENDYYHRVSADPERATGNPWFISTLWLAQHSIARAKSCADLQPGVELLQWVADHAMTSGVLAEQVHPETHEPLSVSPLTWSHAEFVRTVLAYLEKMRVLNP